MKQGKASISGSYDQKVEPSPKPINPGYTSYIGTKLGNHATEEGSNNVNYTPESSGRGYMAPGIGTTRHKSGSQGKH